VVDTSPTFPAEAPHYRRDHALIGPGLQIAEIQVVMLHEPVSDHLPLLVRLRWALPLAPQNRSNNHGHL
jgi:endonuclease/exonuclease/phosphatase family metal-dependent hydrolase